MSFLDDLASTLSGWGEDINSAASSIYDNYIDPAVRGASESYAPTADNLLSGVEQSGANTIDALAGLGEQIQRGYQQVQDFPGDLIDALAVGTGNAPALHPRDEFGNRLDRIMEPIDSGVSAGEMDKAATKYAEAKARADSVRAAREELQNTEMQRRLDLLRSQSAADPEMTFVGKGDNIIRGDGSNFGDPERGSFSKLNRPTHSWSDTGYTNSSGLSEEALQRLNIPENQRPLVEAIARARNPEQLRALEFIARLPRPAASEGEVIDSVLRDVMKMRDSTAGARLAVIRLRSMGLSDERIKQVFNGFNPKS